MTRHAERGLSLIEVTIVMALATLVVMGLISFYTSSQSTWMAGSTQVMAQRDATLLVEAISDSVRVSSVAQVLDADPLHNTLMLFKEGEIEPFWYFWWNPENELVYQGPRLNRDRGPVVASRVTRIQFSSSPRLVEIRLVELRASDGQLVRMASAAALYNRPPESP